MIHTFKNFGKIHILCIILYSLSSCNNIENKKALVNNTSATELTLDSMFKISKFIELETIEESLIGRRICKIRKFNKKYYISSDRNEIIIFHADGKFSHKINKHGDGPGEYNTLSDFDILPNGDIAVVDVKKVIIYDPIGNLKKTIPLDIVGFNIKDIDGKEALICASGEPNVIYRIDYNGTILDTYLENKKSTSIGSCVPFIPLNNKQIIFQIGFSNDFVSYNIRNKRYEEICILNDKECLSSEKEDKLLEQYGFDYLNQYPNLKTIYGVASYDNYMLFKLGSGDKYMVYIIDLRDNTLKYKSAWLKKSASEEIPIIFTHAGVAEDCFINYISYSDFKLMNNKEADINDIDEENPVLMEFVVRQSN